MARNVKIGDTTNIKLTLQNAGVDAGSGEDPLISIFKRGESTPIVDGALMTEHVTSTSRSTWEYNWDTTAEDAAEYTPFIYFNVDTLPQEVEKETIILSIEDFDSLKVAIDGISGGTGINEITFHCKDASANDIEGAKVEIHNTANDQSPILAVGTTDSNGNVTLNLNNGTYTTRAYKNGFTFANTAPVISGDSTEEVVGTAWSISAPSDPTVCRLYLYPKTLSNIEFGSTLEVDIHCQAKTWVKSSDQLISKKTGQFTYDVSTSPDSYYFDAIQGVTVYISCTELGIGEDIVVPEETTQNIYELLTEIT